MTKSLGRPLNKRSPSFSQTYSQRLLCLILKSRVRKVAASIVLYPSLLPHLKPRCGRPIGRKKRSLAYILRIPRFGAEDMEYDIAALRFVSSRTSCPLPEIVSFDLTENNALGMSYMLQYHMPGTCLDHVWNDLSFDQKKSLVRQYIELVCHMRTVTSTSCAVISGSNVSSASNTGPTENFQLESLPDPGKDRGGLGTSPAAPQSTLDFIIDRCERSKAFDLNLGVPPDEHWDIFIAMARTLHVRGFISDDSLYYFTHLDLQPRNIMVTIDSPTVVSVSGILDWDGSLFVPEFMAFGAPYWLWCEKDSEEDDEEQALRVPDCPEEIAFKAMWEQMADEKWKTIALDKEYMFLRRIWTSLEQWSRSTYLMRIYEQVCTEWAEHEKAMGWVESDGE
jgi:hypothetical protein